VVVRARAIGVGRVLAERSGFFGIVRKSTGRHQVIAKETNQSEDDVRGAVEELLEKATLQWEVERLRVEVLRGQLGPRHSHYDRVFENSPRMKAIKHMIDQVADTDATVLVWGESGVGKELVARAIHDGSPRRARTFVKINCAALPLTLLESELFGYERGAFTGAHRRNPGKFELADGGTIFLDEIGEMPLPLQAKLLHVLQAGEFARLGGGGDIKVDVRVIASTNKDLERQIALGAFREDLYYRLNVVNILVPPLRDRPEEIPILAEHLWQKYTRQYHREGDRLSSQVLDRFQTHSWPGNVRELENLVKRIVVLRSEDAVTQELAASEVRSRLGDDPDVPAATALEPATVDGAPARADAWTPGTGLKDFSRRVAHEAERRVIKQVLDDARWNRMEAARQLRISYKALLYKIRMYDLAARAQEPGPA
jgi:two-component system, NtrC family, response regulator AtoC